MLFRSGHETPLGKPRMALQAYMPALQGTGHKASAQQIQECGGILSVLLQEKKEESFKDKSDYTLSSSYAMYFVGTFTEYP